MGRLYPSSAMVIPAAELDKSCTACFFFEPGAACSAARRCNHLDTPRPFEHLTEQNRVHLDPKSVVHIHVRPFS